MKKIGLTIVIVFCTVLSYSQFNPGNNTPGGGSGGGGIPPVGVPPAGVPFDGGLSIILLAAGAGLKIKSKK